jgi:hypothetical protein
MDGQKARSIKKRNLKSTSLTVQNIHLSSKLTLKNIHIEPKITLIFIHLALSNLRF